VRLGVLDVGSNTVHLLVVDAHRGAAPVPARSEKSVLRLAERITKSGELSKAGADELVKTVAEAQAAAEKLGCDDFMAFATSAVREADNSAKVLQQVVDETGVDLQVLSGADEARFTFLAARRWFGWSAGRLLVLDIGGGSLELASGTDEVPDVAVSLPLGAGRLTRERLRGDPPSGSDVRAVRKYVRAEVARVVRDLTRVGPVDCAVGTSKTCRSLARICGAAPSSEGPLVPRKLDRADLEAQLPKLARLTAAERAGLPGVSPGRAHQVLAGAIVADAAMDLLGIDRLQLCPWALREGVILRRLDVIDPVAEVLPAPGQVPVPGG
jgi:exopolyphosphatase/guanosine-5'-triphosphate,3'-diphosphate pyrophosphatase